MSEIEGLKNTRIFDRHGDVWAQTDSMNYGRWYPTLVTCPTGRVRRERRDEARQADLSREHQASGRNVVQTETFDVACGTWIVNGPLAERTLPLYPRLHLLPNGHVFYNAGGQAFDPFGYGYDKALWNIIATYDPATQRGRTSPTRGCRCS